MDNSAKKDLEVFLNQLARFEAPATGEDIASMEAVFGSFPSLDLLGKLVKHYEAAYNKILREDLPAVLEEYGLKKVVIDGGYYDGATVQPQKVVQIKTLDKEAMIAWLGEVGAADIVKDAIALGRGGFDTALSAFLQQNHYDYAYEAKVEGASLKKVISDIIEDREKGGETPLPPANAVQVDQFTVAKITMPKKDKEM